MAKQRELVRILNPGAGAQFTSAKKAIKYVKEGRARVAGEFAIEFIAADSRHLAVLKSIAGQSDEAAPAKPRHSPNLPESIPSSTGTSEYATFGRYPMFPSTAFQRAA